MRLETQNLLKQSRQLSIELYFKWLEENQIVEYFTHPNTVNRVVYEKSWPENVVTIIEGILSFLASSLIFESASGTFHLKERYNLILDANKQNLAGVKRRNQPTYRIIKYCLSLLDDLIMGGNGEWNRRDYILLEQYFGSEVLTNYHYSLFEFIKRFKPIEEISSAKIGILNLYHDLSLKLVVELDIPLENVTLLTFNETLTNLARSLCELNTNTTKLSSKINIISDGDGAKFDFLIIGIHNGLYLKLNQLVELIDQRVNKNGEVYGINFSDVKYDVGFLPLHQFIPGYTEGNNFDKFTKLLKTKSFNHIDFYKENLVVYRAKR